MRTEISIRNPKSVWPGADEAGRVAMAYALLYSCPMRSWIRDVWGPGLLGLVLLSNGCGGRAINKKSARDVIAGSPAAVLAKNDIDVVSVTQAGSREAVAETYLHTAFRLEKVGNDWVIREIKVGQGQWEKLDDLVRTLQQVKIDETRRLLEKIVNAIEAYEQKNGRLPEFQNYVELSDTLYPAYLSPLAREDAWKRPLRAERTSSNTIRLTSAGPDGKIGTPDDIELARTFIKNR